jgi:polysaccharide export outer membrane protein
VSVRGRSAIGLVVLVLGSAGCGTGYPPLPRQGSVIDTPYLVGPGDTVNIVVWRNPDLSMSIPVRPDGKISTPLVEDLQASGKTSTQLARDIEKVLAKYIQSPVVTVIVTTFVGPYSQQIRVIGEAAKPQALAYREALRRAADRSRQGRRSDGRCGNASRRRSDHTAELFLASG